MFYILTFRRDNSYPSIVETFELDEVSRLIDDLVLNQVAFTVTAFPHKPG